MTDHRVAAEPTGRVVGLDGCAGGWFAVWSQHDGSGLGHALYEDLDAVFAAHAEADRLLVDIPIGVTNDGPRECDRKARTMLGLRGVSVFPAPCRAVVDYYQTGADASYDRAVEIQTEQLGSGISKQAWNITGKIAAMDRFLRDHSPTVDVYESHPECCFAALDGGSPIAHSKSSQTGRAARFAVLDDEISGWKDCYTSACEDYFFNQVARDDIIDAMVLVAAGRRSLASIPENPPTDDSSEITPTDDSSEITPTDDSSEITPTDDGLDMQIVVPEYEPAWTEYLAMADQ